MIPTLTILTPQLPPIVPKSKAPSALLRFIQKHRLPISNAASLEFKARVNFVIEDDIRQETCDIIIHNPKSPTSISVVTSRFLRLAKIPQTFVTSEHGIHLLRSGRLIIVNKDESPLDVVISITPEPPL